VAVKRFNESSIEYLKQFRTELEVIFMNCHHPNLLTIKGICTEKSFCVIYEYMEKGTLDQNLVKYKAMAFLVYTICYLFHYSHWS